MSVPHIDWSTKYELGVEDIDLQHHYFLNLINRIASEIITTDDRQYLESLTSELTAYARFHFISEETMMLHAKYPGYEEHRKLHFELIEHLSVVQHHLLNEPTEAEAEETLSFLARWFLEHTIGVDREFTDFLLNRNGKN